MKLLDKQGNATVTVISQTALDETDTVYNFEVQYFSTYHIGELGIWVHNKDCWTSIPSDAQTSRVGNQTVYTFENRGRSVQVINNPDWTPSGTEKKYVEVNVDNGRVNINKALD